MFARVSNSGAGNRMLHCSSSTAASHCRTHTSITATAIALVQHHSGQGTLRDSPGSCQPRTLCTSQQTTVNLSTTTNALTTAPPL